jgi:hypothetical protein
VLADTKLDIDRMIKVQLQARHGVPDVWLVDIAHRQVLRVAEPQAGAYAVQTALNLSWPVLLHGLGEVPGELEALFGAEWSRDDRWKGGPPVSQRHQIRFCGVAIHRRRFRRCPLSQAGASK